MVDTARPAAGWPRDNPHEADKLLRCIDASSHLTRHKNLLSIHLSMNPATGSPNKESCHRPDGTGRVAFAKTTRLVPSHTPYNTLPRTVNQPEGVTSGSIRSTLSCLPVMVPPDEPRGRVSNTTEPVKYPLQAQIGA